MNKREIVRVIRELRDDAIELGMQVDWETATLREPTMRHMTPTQRDIHVGHLNKQAFFNNFNNLKDNDPGDAEQAWA